MTEPVKTASISCLPVWKKGSTAVEWLHELAAMAMEFPERFERCVLVYEKCNAEGLPVVTRIQSRGILSNTDVMGTLESAKLELYDFMKGRK